MTHKQFISKADICRRTGRAILGDTVMIKLHTGYIVRDKNGRSWGFAERPEGLEYLFVDEVDKDVHVFNARRD